jgi:ABC-type antimicrobial peptide transport system permease subunit
VKDASEMETAQPRQLSGNSLWAPSYAFRSLRSSPIRNMGIALILAIGIALPSTVFIWTRTGTTIAVDEYFSEELYHLTVKPGNGESYLSSNLQGAKDALDENKYTEYTHQVSSSIGILRGWFSLGWTSYMAYGLNYAQGIKDMRVLFVTNEILDTWSEDFKCEGNFSLETGQVLVSEMFVNYTRDVYDVRITVGSNISFDLLQNGVDFDVSRTSEQLGSTRVGKLQVMGIYSLVGRSSIISESFIELRRKNWDPFDPNKEPVLGIRDSIMILRDEVSDEVNTRVTGRGFFDPVVFSRASKESLMEDGVERIPDNLLAYKAQIEEEFQRVKVSGTEEVQQLDTNIQTYLQSQVLTVIAFPVMIMSMMLTVFTSESSVTRRSGEVSALRSKGASFNQIFSTFMWESILLGLTGLVLGILLAMVMAPFIASSVGLFIIDIQTYASFFARLRIPPLGLVIAGAIAMYLPAAYLLHVARQIDVSEVGQPMTELPEESTEQVSIWPYVVGLAAILGALLVMPRLIPPVGVQAVGELLIATLLLFGTAYLGARVIRLVTARLSDRSDSILGQSSLYVSQSLRKRKGQFIPLLVILTLTLTTTTMMVIQSSSFQSTVSTELRYSIGADMRIESAPTAFAFSDTLRGYPAVRDVTPVLEVFATVGTNSFFLEGVAAEKYADIGYLTEDSMVSGTPQSVFEELENDRNGVIISSYYQKLWDLEIGDVIYPDVETDSSSTSFSLEVIGIMKSAPGFGMASTENMGGLSLASHFGFQVSQGGFAIVNLDYLASETDMETSELFLVDLLPDTDSTTLIEDLDEQTGIAVYTEQTFDIAQESTSIGLFLSGIQGLATISFLMCAAMGFTAIALFLGSAVRERKHEYAIFRAMGATKRQVVSMVFGEFAGSVIVVIAVSFVMGLVFGYVMSILTVGISPFIPILPVAFSFPIITLPMLLLFQSGIMLASCYYPAKQAGTVDPAVVLRNL